MKKIVITGTSQGIGLELAKILAESHRVIGISRKAPLKTAKQNFTTIPCDMSTSEFASDLAKKIKHELGRIDILINNAGFLVNKPLSKLTQAETAQMFAVNVLGLIECTRNLLPLMKEGAHIVNIGSMGGFQGSLKYPGLSVYSSTKAAVAGFTEALAVELSGTGISVNCLALGAVNTKMLQRAFPDYKASTSAREMANFIADFALKGNKFFNGKILPVAQSNP